MLANHESNQKNIPQRKEGSLKYCRELLLLFMSGVVQIFHLSSNLWDAVWANCKLEQPCRSSSVETSQDDSDSSGFESNAIIQIGLFIIRLTPRDLQKSSYPIGTPTYSPVSFCFLWVYLVTWQCKPVAPNGWLGICVTSSQKAEHSAIKMMKFQGNFRFSTWMCLWKGQVAMCCPCLMSKSFSVLQTFFLTCWLVYDQSISIVYEAYEWCTWEYSLLLCRCFLTTERWRNTIVVCPSKLHVCGSSSVANENKSDCWIEIVFRYTVDFGDHHWFIDLLKLSLHTCSYRW